MTIVASPPPHARCKHISGLDRARERESERAGEREGWFCPRRGPTRSAAERVWLFSDVAQDAILRYIRVGSVGCLPERPHPGPGVWPFSNVAQDAILRYIRVGSVGCPPVRPHLGPGVWPFSDVAQDAILRYARAGSVGCPPVRPHPGPPPHAGEGVGLFLFMRLSLSGGSGAATRAARAGCQRRTILRRRPERARVRHRNRRRCASRGSTGSGL